MIENDHQSTYCRIDLSKTNYTILSNSRLLEDPDVELCRHIYRQYCAYKGFISVEPLFNLDFTMLYNDVIGYFDGNHMVAFSIINNYAAERSVYAMQFAWDYAKPELKLGHLSLRSECAYYKELGYEYYYLGEAHKYKSELKGFEII